MIITKKQKLIGAGGVVIIAVSLFIFSLLNTTKADSIDLNKQPSSINTDVNALFNRMLNNSLDTQSLTQDQQVTLRSASGSAGLVNSISEASTFRYNFESGVEQPNLDLHLIDYSGDQFRIEGDYVMGAGKAYANIRSISGQMTAKLFSINPNFPNYTNKWFPLSSDDTSAQLVNTQYFADLKSINALQVGQFIFGNFSALDRKDLVQLIQAEQVYKYFPAKVRVETVNGKKLIIYPVTINNNGIVKLNQAVAQIKNRQISAQDQQSLYEFEAEKVDLYVDPVTNQLVKIVEDVAGSNVGRSTTEYSGYNTTAVKPLPTPDLTTDATNEIINSLYSAGF
jgi:hypothetical protein